MLAPNLFHEEARDYVTTLRAALRDDPRSVLYDSRVPAQVIDPLFGDRDRVSEVVGVAPEAPVFDVPTSRMRVVTPEGKLVEPQLGVATSAPPGANPVCNYPVRATGTTIPLAESLPVDRWIARIGYYTNAESFVDLRAADHELGFGVTPGLHVVHVQLDGALEDLNLTLAGPGTVCVTNVDVGIPVGAVP